MDGNHSRSNLVTRCHHANIARMYSLHRLGTLHPPCPHSSATKTPPLLVGPLATSGNDEDHGRFESAVSMV